MLSVGTRFGPYEVISLLGSGGMGEVYRARDTALHRLVAIKVLPDSFARDPERIARLEREARTLASLNHPNIAAIFGFYNNEDGRQALVLEFVDGPTLADRIARGALPVAESLAIARQIARALEAAHRQGIVPRDLKPANIKVREDGTVKVLDFGLAKAFNGGPVADGSSLATITAPAVLNLVVTADASSPQPQPIGDPAFGAATMDWHDSALVLFKNSQMFLVHPPQGRASPWLPSPFTIYGARFSPNGRFAPPRVIREGGLAYDTADMVLRFYDVAPDGRVVVVEPAESKNASVVLAQHWDEALKALAAK